MSLTNAAHLNCCLQTQFLHFMEDILRGADGASAPNHVMVALKIALEHVQIPYQHTGEEDVFSRDWDELERNADATLIKDAQVSF